MSSPAVTDGTSKFYAGWDLLMAPGAGLMLQDILFSAAQVYEPESDVLLPITKIANAQIGVSWGSDHQQGSIKCHLSFRHTLTMKNLQPPY